MKENCVTAGAKAVNLDFLDAGPDIIIGLNEVLAYIFNILLLNYANKKYIVATM